ncbi:flagella basal body P-ring formation protein FlgA [Noviherbaspirillum cavernae]|uniref:Flagella basal body P-ring formation protein FlgA n=1 Tax=Noviherbaspirillum cavernae TaxID=2320862 RepID=A0A418WWK4_9BURK|nr:flagellar basal body P-ring formation chaperone FlgA [Noviherbaspirillum cavernae]RJF97038.1 flagella basal body P-ring formation protein FlgA [Noviherbaspirillum cavernae]
MTHVSAAAERVTERVEAAARALLVQQAERAGLRDPLVEVSVVRNGQPAPACATPVKLENMDTRQPSRMRIAAMCPGADGWRHEFIVRASVSAQVLVAATVIPARQVLEATDLTLERRTVSTTPDAISEPQEVVGMAARRAMRAGDIVRKNALIAPTLVKRGDAVRILASREQIAVSVAGEALDGGTRGAIVRVRNAANGNVIRARVIANATVEPADMPVSMPAHSPD